MKKNNKGFTLVEVVTTIALLVLLVGIIVPSYVSIQRNNEIKNYKKLKETILNAAENYYQNNLSLGSLTECHITVNDLANKKLIKTPIITPKNNDEISLSTYIKISKTINIDSSLEINYSFLDTPPQTVIHCPKKVNNNLINNDTIAPNKPVLAEGMIPVIYNMTNNTWVKADINSEWYNYDAQMWANAVTVTSTNRDKYLDENYVGEIPLTEINSMWVWIPRFKYRIVGQYGTHLDGTAGTAGIPGAIDIVFEKGTEATGISKTEYKTAFDNKDVNIGYYTHPAFRDIDNIGYSETESKGGWDEEITGFWVSKFYGNGNPNNSTPPTSSNNHSTQFNNAINIAGGVLNSSGTVTFSGNSNYGFTGDIDTHLMKNTEWGAVIYLTQSIYGKYGNSDYTIGNKNLNKNAYYQGSSSIKNSTSFCYYNNFINRNVGAGPCGPGASTTGTIYGAYDLNTDFLYSIMGNWNNLTRSSGFSPIPARKYLDYYYTSGKYSNWDSSYIIGDATFETRGWYGGGYYTGFKITTSTGNPWVYRGTDDRTGSKTEGIFSVTVAGGGYLQNHSFVWRAVLIP